MTSASDALFYRSIMKLNRWLLLACAASGLMLPPAEAKTKHRRSPAGSSGRKTSAARSRQSSPTPDRYREIQEALAAKGYLSSPPSGVWDAQSQEAMRKFQADQNIEQTGKVNSLSLIALGLGPASRTNNQPPKPVSAQ